MGNLKGKRFKVTYLAQFDLRNGIKEGDEGVILENDTNPHVRMDKYNDELGDAGGLCEDGHGTYMYLPQIELLLE